MLRQDKEILQFDTIQVDNEINKNNEYKLETEEIKILIKYNLKNEKEQKYFSIIEIKNVCKYIGILSDNFTKEKLGINYYGNKDIYLGEWKNNLKEGNGLYIYDNPNNKKEIYIGKWEKGFKFGKGIYIISNENFTDCTIFFGNTNNDNFENGYIIENNKIRKLYKGKLKDLKKDDDNGILLEGIDKAFFGKFKNDEIIEGNTVVYKIENGKVNITNLFNFKVIDDKSNNYNFEIIEDLNYGNYTQIIYDLIQKKYFDNIENYFLQLKEFIKENEDNKIFEKNINDNNILNLLKNYEEII
jgi:hypothetical protein